MQETIELRLDPKGVEGDSLADASAPTAAGTVPKRKATSYQNFSSLNHSDTPTSLPLLYAQGAGPLPRGPWAARPSFSPVSPLLSEASTVFLWPKGLVSRG
ncbi:hypothetical protein N7539_007234 [Penicillium diatomitis]|uniref:Uncharacterized protein n=1 Tax=Penicillium diatomitis TaxID=2819901 RepID=A0A9W9WUR1_9EURO|nr:uncharacterized protein N7539_007234 [Penicillium diatomitis]KAJ5477090.1 hypothetical protein N7539_007234 [Penicillium diatomitis]